MCVNSTALLVIDMQIDNCSPNGARANSGESMSQIYKILPNIEQLVKALRVKNVPILLQST